MNRPAPNGNPTRPSRQTQFATYACLAVILLLAACLHFYRLEQEGFANRYYAAAVRSMLASWRNFFFASFDPAGFVSVDKPPLGLWIQALSAWLLGFRGWSLLLPQALAGVLSVGLLYGLVARSFGRGAGLLAALLLALSPIYVAANRNNTMDSLLVLVSLLAAWAAIRAAERGRLGWLLLCALLLGLGFNIKMLQAYLVLPACFLPYLLAAPLSWPRRLLHLSLATVLLVAVSLSWALVVDLTPSEQRPYVGSSRNNTVMELILGHNGAERLGAVGRLFGLRMGPPRQPGNALPGAPGVGPQPAQPGNASPAPPAAIPQPAQPYLPGSPSPNPSPPGSQPAPGGSGTAGETGQPGLGRLFNRQLGGQIAWFLPLALLCLLAAALPRPHSRLPGSPSPSLLLWGTWLLPQALFFSYAGLFHRYYLEMMAPAIAALVGGGGMAMWQDYRERRRAWMLPLALLLTALTQLYLLLAFPDWARWLAPVAVGMPALACLVLAGLLLVQCEPASANRLARALLLPSLAALLLAPAAWSAIPVWYGGDVALPYAGPELLEGPGPARRSGPGNALPVDRLETYLLDQYQGQRFLLATINAQSAAPLILSTSKAVMALGGFSGSDPILDAGEMAAMVRDGELRFFLLPAPSPGPSIPLTGPGPIPGPVQAQGQLPAPPLPGLPLPGSPVPGQAPLPNQFELLRWVWQNCHPVPEHLWRLPGAPGPGATPELQILWDCRGPAR